MSIFKFQTAIFVLFIFTNKNNNDIFYYMKTICFVMPTNLSLLLTETCILTVVALYGWVLTIGNNNIFKPERGSSCYTKVNNIIGLIIF